MTLLSWHRLSRRLSGGLLAALLLATLAPAVSRALAAGPPQDGQVKHGSSSGCASM